MVPRNTISGVSLAATAALLLSLSGCGDDAPEWEPYPVYDGPPVGAAPGDTVKPKVMIIGLDGADFRNVMPLSEAGRLPTLTRLMNEGVRGHLATNHTASPVVWTTVATGVSPEKHGIRSFRNEKNQIVSSRMRTAPTFWNILSYYNRTVGVVSWWASFPAEHVNGYLISPYVVLQPPAGFRARAHTLGEKDGVGKSYPPELHEALADLLRRPEDLDLSQWKHLHADVKKTTNTPWVIAKDTSYHEMALRLLEADPVETFAVYFQGIDAASHDWNRYVIGENKNEVRPAKVSPEEVVAANARVEAMYVHNDGMVGRLIEKAQPETDIIVLSDHGWNYDGTAHFQKLPGVFIAKGPSFRAKGEFEGLHVRDITPIVLAIIGVPLSRELEGKVPEGLLTDEVMSKVTYVDSYGLPPVALPDNFEFDAEGLDAAHLEHLKMLGYVGDDKKDEKKKDGDEKDEDGGDGQSGEPPK